MSDNGNTEFTAAALSRLLARQEKLQELIGSFSSSLVGMESSMRKSATVPTNDGIEKMLSAIEQTLADLTNALESTEVAKAIEALTQAMADMKPPAVNVDVPAQAAPHVNVQVSPTPITFEAVLPAQAPPIVNVHVPAMPDMKGARWEVRIPSVMGGPDRVMTITRN